MIINACEILLDNLYRQILINLIHLFNPIILPLMVKKKVSVRKIFAL